MRCFAAVALLAVIAPCVVAKDADAKDAARWVRNALETSDAKAREKELAKLAGWTLTADSARQVRQATLDWQRQAPKELPKLEVIHEGAYGFDYEVRTRGTKYANFAMLDLPRGLSADTPVPLVIGLHSDLGTGWLELSGLRSCLRGGTGALAECIIACPQALNRGNTATDPRNNPPGEKEYFGWGPKQAGIDTVLVLLDELLAKFSIDRDRIYLTGVGMGGQACFDLVALRPSQFAAICVRDAVPSFHMPEVKEDQLEQLRTDRKLHEQSAEMPYAACFAATPVFWAHADDDKKFPTAWARQARDAMKAAGASVDYREYEGFHGGGPASLTAALLGECLKIRRTTPTALVARNTIADKDRIGNDRWFWLRVKGFKRLGARTDWPVKRHAGGLVKARIVREENAVYIDSDEVSEVEVLLHDDMLYIDREIRLVINGKESTTKPPPRDLELLARTADEARHSSEVYYARLTLKLR
ncbi:MAG: prolyl oligopeptidase family serine peptidase [Planctomycetes bacterium]|nr:prolyl oligopeptidase family serine peptidase [Planctomycetota bacterium]MCW8135246.1 prolyl oligopeptidase family serine peptidase [Planctomycetota bacterium]